MMSWNLPSTKNPTPEALKLNPAPKLMPNLVSRDGRPEVRLVLDVINPAAADQVRVELALGRSGEFIHRIRGAGDDLVLAPTAIKTQLIVRPIDLETDRAGRRLKLNQGQTVPAGLQPVAGRTGGHGEAATHPELHWRLRGTVARLRLSPRQTPMALNKRLMMYSASSKPDAHSDGDEFQTFPGGEYVVESTFSEETNPTGLEIEARARVQTEFGGGSGG